MSRILVVKLGALGDFVLAFGPFAAIRAEHEAAEITLLTTAPFAELARAAPWFDRVVVDRRPRPWDLPGLLRLRRALRGFDMVYDLQTSDRSGWYFWLAGRPPWSGIARGCSHPHDNPGRDAMHTVERQRDQMASAGVTRFPKPDLRWLANGDPRSASRLPLPSFTGGGDASAVLIPGAAPHRPRKRWPAERFGALADELARLGYRVSVIGTAADAPLAEAISDRCQTRIADLTGRTDMLQLARTLADADLVVGNDTGPTHLAAALGIPTIALFSADSDPALTRPRGAVTVIAVPDLADLPVERVVAALPRVHSTQPATMEAT